MLRRLYRRLLHAVDNHGLRGLLRRIVSRFKPVHESESERPNLPHPFDLAHQVDTSGYVPGEQLTAFDLYNTAYYGISPSALKRALELLPEPLSGFTFLDIGCGKGRALLIAAEFDFPHILGVELSPELCRIAEFNTHSNPRVEIRQEDAATLAFPASPLVIFLYHPFLSPVLQRVLTNLERHQRANPLPIYLLYANLTYPKVFARFPFLQQIWDYSIPLSAEDAAADRHRITHERFTLYRATP